MSHTLCNIVFLCIVSITAALVFVSEQVVQPNTAVAQLNATSPPVIQEDDSGSQVSQNGSRIYEDKDVGFTIKYPSDWTVGEEDAQLNSVVSFNAPIGGSIVDVRVFPQGTWKSIKDYGNDFKNYEDNTLLAYYRNSTTLIDGKPAFRAIYLTTYNPSVFEESLGYSSSTSKAMIVATHVPEKKSIFSLIYFADPKDFDVNRPVLEDMLKSFKIGSKGPVIQEED